jgi:hypothetical protein
VSRVLLLPLAAALLLAGCSRDPRKAVLGEWRSDAGRMLFYPDGQVLMEQTSDSTASVARYEFVDARKLRIRSLAADPADYGVRITRDSLVLCAAASPAQCFRLRRATGARR